MADCSAVAVVTADTGGGEAEARTGGGRQAVGGWRRAVQAVDNGRQGSGRCRKWARRLSVGELGYWVRTTSMSKVVRYYSARIFGAVPEMHWAGSGDAVSVRLRQGGRGGTGTSAGSLYCNSVTNTGWCVGSCLVAPIAIARSGRENNCGREQGRDGYRLIRYGGGANNITAETASAGEGCRIPNAPGTPRDRELGDLRGSFYESKRENK